MVEKNFVKELEELINKYSVENESDTPDFILAGYIARCLDAYAYTITQRDQWWGDKHWDKKEVHP